jgi:TPR repeat protein
MFPAIRKLKGQAAAVQGIALALLIAAGVVPVSTLEADELKAIALEFNDATSSYLIAEKHFKGVGAIQDYEQALFWYQKAAELGHVRSMAKLGEMYYYGIGIEKDFNKALLWLRKPAQEGYSDAQYLLGMIYLTGNSNNGVKKDLKQAFLWLRRAADEFHGDAAYQVGRMLYYGQGVAKDSKESRRYLNIAKELQIKRAVNLLAQIEQAERAAKVPEKPVVKQTPRKKSVLELAKSGDSNAQYELAEFYFNGTGNRHLDVDEALVWYGKAARGGNVQAQYKIGAFSYYGQIVRKDLSTARTWLARAAEQGHNGAEKLLALIDAQENAKRNEKSAIQTLTSAANNGDADAQYKLASVYLNGNNGFEADREQALKWFRAAAAQNHAEAQFQTGMMNFNPESLENESAERWLVNAAENDHTEAAYFLGSLYNAQGEFTKAAIWLDKAVEKEHTNALDLLVSLYLEGRIENVETAQAISWLEKASRRGYIEAQYQLGIHYLKDSEQNANRAFEWIQKAARSDHVSAQYRLGVMYEHGVGVRRHYVRAANWYKKAAEQNQVDAQFALAEMYRQGLGLPKIKSKAKKWYEAAAAQGHMKAKLRLRGSALY